MRGVNSYVPYRETFNINVAYDCCDYKNLSTMVLDLRETFGVIIKKMRN